MSPALLLLAAALPAAAADLDALADAHARCLAALAADVAGMRDVRAAFPGAEDKEGLLSRWETRRSSFTAEWEKASDIRADFHAGARGVVFLAMAHGLSKASMGNPPSEGSDGPTAGRMRQGVRMRGDANSLLSAFRDEEAAFAPLKAGFLRERAAARRWLWGAAAAAASALVAAGAYAFAGPRPAPPLAAPTTSSDVAANFTILRRLGAGGAGEVYEARDRTLERPVALKRLRPELLADHAALEALLAEARLLAGLKHPNMVALYGVERDAGEVYLAFELVEGATLEERLAREKRLPWAEALRVAAAAGAAVDYCHAQKVIHRALKPSNILLGTDGAVKVTDFSIAYRAAESVSRLTRAPSWGAPPYMSPEQELGSLSAAADLYALGVIFYESLTGARPFPGPDFLAQKRAAAWVPPSRLVAGLPPGTDAAFARALAPDPARRFPNAAALTAAFTS